MKPRPCRAAIACAIGLLGAFATSTPARATDVEIEADTLRILDTVGEPNALDVRPGAFGYHVFDDLSRLAPSAGCVGLSLHHVLCIAMIERMSIESAGGADVILLGEVKIPVHVGAGADDDLVEGGQVGDRLDGEAGNDRVIGEAGNDDMLGGDDDDSLAGGTGADQINGGPGADTAAGESGSGDVLRGDDGADLLEGGAGDDALQGGPGSDVLVTGSGHDTVSTGDGVDKVFGTSEDQVGPCANPGDKVATGSAPLPPGCEALPSTEMVPRIWPPPANELDEPVGAGPRASTRATALRVRAARQALPKPFGLTNVTPVRRRKTHTLVFHAKSLYEQRVRVRVRTYARDGHELDVFLADVVTKQPYRFPNRNRNRAVWKARARCCL